VSNNVERLFFALWPNHKIGQSLTEAYAGVTELAGQGRIMEPSNLHITLHFLGNTPVDRIACFIDSAHKIESPSFELEINHLGYFERPGVSWLGPVEIPEALLQLQRLLGEKIKHCKFEPELRPYRPHVTMARKVKQSVTIDQTKPICWKVDSFTLVQSVGQGASVKYHVKNTFPLNL